MKKYLVFWVLSLSGSFSFAQPLSPGVEALLGSMISPGGVRIQVQSGGCTTKESFVVQKEKVDGVWLVTFMRRKADRCLALYRYGRILRYSYEDMGLMEDEIFVIGNPLMSSVVR